MWRNAWMELRTFIIFLFLSMDSKLQLDFIASWALSFFSHSGFSHDHDTLLTSILRKVLQSHAREEKRRKKTKQEHDPSTQMTATSGTHPTYLRSIFDTNNLLNLSTPSLLKIKIGKNGLYTPSEPNLPLSAPVPAQVRFLNLCSVPRATC